MRCLIVAALLVTAVAVPAQGHFSPTSRVHNARHVAETVYGPNLCDVGTMNIPIIRRRGLATERGAVGLFYRNAGEMPYTGCLIFVDDRPWPTRDLCRLLGHEFGHAAGLGHSPDPQDIMYSTLISYWAPCDQARWR